MPTRVYAGAPARRRPSKGVWRIGRDIWAGLAGWSPGVVFPRLLAVFWPFSGRCQRWPALSFASVNPLPVNGLAVCQCQRLPAVASPASAQLASVGPLAACQPPAVASRPALPAAAAPAVASGRGWGSLPACQRWPVVAPSSPVDARTGAAC